MEEYRDKDGVDEIEGRWESGLDGVEGRVMQGEVRDAERDRWRVRFLFWVQWKPGRVGNRRMARSHSQSVCFPINSTHPLCSPSAHHHKTGLSFQSCVFQLVLGADNSLIQGHVGKWKNGGFYSRASEHWLPLTRSSVFNSWWKGTGTFQMSLPKDTVWYCDVFNTLDRVS